MRDSLSCTSREIYRKFVSDFLSFIQEFFPEKNCGFPCVSYQVTYYVAFLTRSGSSASSIKSRISAINFVHKLFGGTDLHSDFILRKCLLGVAKTHTSIDVRAPITLHILIKLCNAVTSLYSDQYFVALMHAMFTLAFVAFLRIGEITKTGSAYNPNLLNLQNISVSNNPPSLSVTFQHFKHKSPGPPFCLQVGNLPQIPVIHYVAKYIQLRGPQKGPLFLYKNAPIPRSLFAQTMNQCLKFLNLSHLPYKSHSFRIGAASHALATGASYDQVKLMGRWKSNALSKYIRVHSLQSISS